MNPYKITPQLLSAVLEDTTEEQATQAALTMRLDQHWRVELRTFTKLVLLDEYNFERLLLAAPAWKPLAAKVATEPLIVAVEGSMEEKDAEAVTAAVQLLLKELVGTQQLTFVTSPRIRATTDDKQTCLCLCVHALSLPEQSSALPSSLPADGLHRTDAVDAAGLTPQTRKGSSKRRSTRTGSESALDREFRERARSVVRDLG